MPLYIFGLLIIIFVIVYQYLAFKTFDSTREAKLGVTFSKSYAIYLGLDWQKSLTAMLDDLKIRYFRIPIYWEDIESKQGVYDFSGIDWQLDQIAARGAKAIVVVGFRQPRWPECHAPEWAKDLSDTDRMAAIKKMITDVVSRYKNHPAVEVWQVENEPLLNVFGECPKGDPAFLKEEVNLVRSLDDKPIMVTGSGELAIWNDEAKLSDILGSTMYRRTWNKYYGYASYWFLPASSYRIKAWLVGHKDLKTFWISELQAEPWIPGGDIFKASLAEQYKTMSPEKLQKSLDYALNANTGRIYLWGAEWWYYAKEKLGADAIWETAKKFDWKK